MCIRDSSTVFYTAYFRKNTAKWHELVFLRHYYTTYFVFFYTCIFSYIYWIRNWTRQRNTIFPERIMDHVAHFSTCSINRIALLNCVQYKSSHYYIPPWLRGADPTLPPTYLANINKVAKSGTLLCGSKNVWHWCTYVDFDDRFRAWINIARSGVNIC